MITAPEPLSAKHFVAGFDSGEPDLDSWLERRATMNQSSGASRTFVITENSRVVGYYALAAGSVHQIDTAGRFRRNMPDPVPVVLLGRLAVHRELHGQGIGRALFRDAVKRVTVAADSIGIRGLLVHAISDDAKRFYLKLGLEESRRDPMVLLATLPDLVAGLDVELE